MDIKIDEVRDLAEQKNKKTTAKTTAKKKTETKQAKSSEKKTETKTTKKETSKKETTKVNAKPARFGDSLLDEIILLLIIVVAIVIFVSLLTDKMGIIGGLISAFVKGLFGFSGLLLPVFVVVFCIWMLASEEKKYPAVRAIGAFLFLLTLASAAHIINPVETGDVGFLKRCGELYGAGAFSNGGLLGGLIGGGLYSVLDTLGSAIILLAVGIISVVMATGKSFFHAIGDANAHRKARKKVRNEKIKNKAERIRQQELVEAERLAKKEERRKKTMAKEDFNIELHESKGEEVPYVKETVFQKKPMNLETKKKEPIFDFVKEKEREANLKAAAEKYVAETSSNAMKAAASMMADSALKSVQMQEELPVMPRVEEAKEEIPVVQMPEIDENAPIIDIAGVDEATLMPARKAEPVEEDIPIIEMEADLEELQEEEIPVAEIEEMAEVSSAEEQQEETEAAVEEKKAEDVPAPEIPTEPVEEEKPYIYPPIELLGADPQTGSTGNRSEMIENARKLESTLKSFGVDAKVIQISKGPTVTRYELSPSQGVKVSKIVNLADDIALNLAASGIRIEAPIPGKAAVGIEVPNKETQSVYMRTLLESDAFKEHPSKLAFALGQDIAGNPVVTDIAKMPHLLIAGATGSGKSVCINTLITSILYKADPKEVKLLLVDPKVVELSVYNGIPHLLIPVVTDPKKASSALNWAVREMLQRYNDFAAHGVRDIKGFNKML